MQEEDGVQGEGEGGFGAGGHFCGDGLGGEIGLKGFKRVGWRMERLIRGMRMESKLTHVTDLVRILFGGLGWEVWRMGYGGYRGAKCWGMVLEVNWVNACLLWFKILWVGRDRLM